MNASGACLSLIKRSESCRLASYQDSGGVWTIGWGHTGTDVRDGLVITQAMADWLLRDDVKRTELAVDRLVLGTPLTQGQYDALVDFAYNVGARNLEGSTLLSKLKAGDIPGAAEEFLRWDHVREGGTEVEVAGLLERRRAERAMFLGRVG